VDEGNSMRAPKPRLCRRQDVGAVLSIFGFNDIIPPSVTYVQAVSQFQEAILI